MKEFPSPDPSDPTLEAWVAYPNLGRGFGHGLTDRGFLTRSGYLLPEGYCRTSNMTAGQTLSPSFSNESPSSHSGNAPRVAFAIPWVDDSTIPVPTIVIGCGQAAFTYKNNATSGDTEVLAGYFWDGCLHDNAGTELLYAATVSSLITQAAAALQRRTKAGVWTKEDTVVAKFITSAAGALWRASSDYQVSKCPAGSDPFTIGNWGGAFQVGTNTNKITSMASIGAAPVIGKEDGLYQFSEADNRFNPIFTVNPHPQNFPFMKSDNAGGLWTSLYDGSAVHISQFGSIVVYNPLRNKPTSRDVPRNPITDAVPFGDAVYFLTGAARLTHSNNLTALKTADNFGTFTAYTTEGDDKSFATSIDISSLDTLANGDALLIGFAEQFMAVEFFMTAVNANATTITAAYSTGAGTWTSLLTLTDETSGFTNSGRFVADFSAVNPALWVKATYNSTERYWMRFTVSAALDSSTTIGEIAILPLRTGPRFSTTQLPYSTNVETSGGFSKILRLRFEGDTPIWDDVYTLYSGDGSQICVSPMPAKNSPSGSLWAFGKASVAQFALPPNAEPHTTPFPLLARDSAGDTGLGLAIPPVFYPSAIFTAGQYELAYLVCYGDNLAEQTDIQAAAFRWDDTNAWFVMDQIKENNAVFQGSLSGNNYGTTLHLATQLLDANATDPIGPSVSAVVAWLRPVADRTPLRPARQIPEVS